MKAAGSRLRDTMLVLTCGKVLREPPRRHWNRRLEEDKNRRRVKNKLKCVQLLFFLAKSNGLKAKTCDTSSKKLKHTVFYYIALHNTYKKVCTCQFLKLFITISSLLDQGMKEYIPSTAFYWHVSWRDKYNFCIFTYFGFLSIFT